MNKILICAIEHLAFFVVVVVVSILMFSFTQFSTRKYNFRHSLTHGYKMIQMCVLELDRTFTFFIPFFQNKERL